MSKINDGGPAFPQSTTYGSSGMSLRAYFAGQAMQAIIASQTIIKEPNTIMGTAVAVADCLIAELEKGNKP